MSEEREFRIGLAIFVLVLTVIGDWLFSIDTATTPTASVKFVDATPNMKYYIGNRAEFGGFSFEENQGEGSSVIISTNKYYTAPEGYIENKFGHTVIAAGFPDKIAKQNSKDLTSFKTSRGSGYEYLMVDMEKLINKFISSEDGRIDLTEIGFEAKINNFTLMLPDNAHYYRRDCIDALIYILTNGKEVTEENASEVKEKLDKLMKNAVNVANVAEEITDMSNGCLIVPEHVFMGIDELNFPVYWNKCYAVETKAYFKESIDESVVESVVNDLKNDKKMFKSTAIRNNITGNTLNYAVTADSLNIVYGQDNLEELLGSEYWKA